MKLFLPGIFLLLSFLSYTQGTPVIQWQKCFGGSKSEGAGLSQPTSDGGFILAGITGSDDGDLVNNSLLKRLWVVKTDAAGNVQWQTNFGSPASVNEILQSADGGYILVATSSATDGDVIGNHGQSDVWVIKLNSAGVVQWQKCYGGSETEQANSIRRTADGGYIIGGETNSGDGDVTGFHGIAGTMNAWDAWILKIDAVGSLQWQRCFGGIRAETITTVIPTPDGGYFFTASAMSTDGDLSCTIFNQDLWMVKLDNTGNILWQRCQGGNYGEKANDILLTQDGGFIIAGMSASSDMPGTHGGTDAWVIRMDVTGTVQWQRLLGGSGSDQAQRIQSTPDGGYIVAGYTSSADGNICNNKGAEDFWIVKLTSGGSIQWQKTYGGSDMDILSAIHLTPEGGYLVTGYTRSNDGDVTGNHGMFDLWMLKLSFPGIELLPLVSITASDNIICPGQEITFIAIPANGGAVPSYQWQVNGVNAGTDNDTVILNTLTSGDMVSCILTSGDACVTSPTALSNTITITVDPFMTPSNFLAGDTVVCSYGTLDLKATGSYTSYLWSNNVTTPVLSISQPGTYWLRVTTNTGCSGRDTILVGLKECIKGFFMPTAFTPNGDGRNDILRPVLGGRILKYELTIVNRWGQVVFRANEPGKGWDGTFNGKKQDSNVFVWTCSYQFASENPTFAKGTVAIIR